MPIKAIYLTNMPNINDEKLLPCPFCGAPGKIIKDEDDIIRAICPSGLGVTCTGDCWIGGTIIDYNAWQHRDERGDK